MNVLIYVIDALRSDRVGTYGHHRDTTPAFDSLAKDGVVFEQCITPATWTRPAAASILSGLYPPAHGTRDQVTGYNPPTFSLPENFKHEGYQTAAIGSGPNIQGEWGFDRGFDYYIDLFDDEQIKENRSELRPGVPHVRAEDLTTKILEWFDEEHDDSDFFLLAWSNEVHAPYTPPSEYRTYVDSSYEGEVNGSPDTFSKVQTDADRNHLKSLYDGEVRYNDACFNDLLNGLHKRGLYEDTMIICIGDHGDGLGEHPGFFGHGTTPYEELIHVPCIIRSPEVESGHRVAEIMSLVDLYPTILKTINKIDKSETNVETQGKSLAQALKGHRAPCNRSVFVEGHTHDETTSYHVVRTADWKLIETGINIEDRSYTSGENFMELARAALNSGRVFDIIMNPFYYWNRHIDTNPLLFNIKNDPQEETNVIGQYPEKEDELADSIDIWLNDCIRFRNQYEGPDEITMDSDSEQKLKALGYLEDN